ncbi:MAG: hypothetical protein DI564_00730 [Rhodanobacter denitrificans]|uniref:HTH cro/C1-type domain-containing protein n=1 Tax=Rhodanobacter denitrificans TaxID=666685 RepID=A0A2W5KRW3_9GAMM|nr:MAG: hypothetical protein DI564_00730 [Rhodanobacter denitrificans]
MKINGAMVVLAREIRGLSQEDLARLVSTSQATIARIEGSEWGEVEDVRAGMLAKALDFPPEFLSQKEELIGFGSSAYFYRKKASLQAQDRKRIHGVVNGIRINLKRLLDSLEIVPKRPLPELEVEQYGTASRAAQALRAYWNVPDGPLTNLTSLIESAGVIVVPTDFGTSAMDATSLRLAEMPPLIFINKDIPGDRWRFTLAHELAHLVLHQVPHESMEDEADEFAAELLLPDLELKAAFARLPKIRLVDLINMKPYWKVSVAALIERAYGLRFIDSNARRYLWVSLKRVGYPVEPVSIAREDAKNHRGMLEHFTRTLQYSNEELAELFKINQRDLATWHGPSMPSLQPKQNHLRAVPKTSKSFS